MKSRIYNFSAGPAALPEAVLKEVQSEVLNYRGCGMSVMELSHRGRVFGEIIEQAEADLRELLDVPENYHVLFLQGGGTQQFSMVPLNLKRNGTADYILSGSWSKKAFGEAKKSMEARGIPYSDAPPIREDADFVYICENETIDGFAYPSLPDTKGRPLVSDQSSMFLSKPCDIRNYGLIFAGVQKNVGPAGMAIVIIRDDLLRDISSLPACLSYAVQTKAKSLYNTPNCWSIYVCGKVFRHLISSGGLEAAQRRNEEKAKRLYDFLDKSRLFRCFVAEPFRSSMNVTFTTGDHILDQKLTLRAEAAGLVGLGGHKSVGGLRASLYNAMTLDGVEALVSFLEEFEHRE